MGDRPIIVASDIHDRVAVNVETRSLIVIVRCPRSLFDFSEDAITGKICVWTGGECVNPSKILMLQAEAPDQILQNQAIFLCCRGFIEWLVFVQTAIHIFRATAGVVGAPTLYKISIACRTTNRHCQDGVNQCESL